MTTANLRMIGIAALGSFLISAPEATRAMAAGRAMRAVEQTDPISGLHWSRIADPQHPSAPPRLTPVDGKGKTAEAGGRKEVCIRAGDDVVLQSGTGHSATISLKATALASGVRGDRIRARVAVTGATLTVTVLGSGSGSITSAPGGWQ